MESACAAYPDELSRFGLKHTANLDEQDLFTREGGRQFPFSCAPGSQLTQLLVGGRGRQQILETQKDQQSVVRGQEWHPQAIIEGEYFTAFLER